MNTLKSVLFRNNLGKSLPILYRLYGDCCVFTAGYKSNLAPTIQNAEGIVGAIVEQEKRSLASMRYFDLQTRKSYGFFHGQLPNLGNFIFDEVVFAEGSALAKRWDQTVCPPYVIDDFRHMIDDGGLPEQIFRDVDTRIIVNFPTTSR